MELTTFQFFSIIGISSTAILGIFNLVLTIKSQRKTHRELFFTKQFEFFMQLCELIAEIEDNFFNIYDRDNSESIKKITALSENIDLLVTKNELIIPNDLYFKINECVVYYYKNVSISKSSPDKINDEIKKEFSGKCSDLIMDIREYIGMEHLSEENRKLVKGRINRKSTSG